jgi:NADH dehydrogenase FAD-containing subunit
MVPRITHELLTALNQQPDQPLRIEDAAANRVYFLMDEQLGQQAMEALHEQKLLIDLKTSIAQADSGESVTLEQAKIELFNQQDLPL